MLSGRITIITTSFLFCQKRSTLAELNNSSKSKILSCASQIPKQQMQKIPEGAGLISQQQLVIKSKIVQTVWIQTKELVASLSRFNDTKTVLVEW